MTSPQRDITSLLDRAKRRRRLVILAAAGAGALAAALMVLVLGAGALALGARAGLVRWLVAVACAHALGVGVVWAFRALRRGTWTPEGVARTVAAGSPALRSDLVSAVELSRQREALAASGAVSVTGLRNISARSVPGRRGIYRPRLLIGARIFCTTHPISSLRNVN